MPIARPALYTFILAGIATIALACGSSDVEEADIDRELSPQRTAEILELLLDRDVSDARLQPALDEIIEAGDTRFVAVFIELQRAGPSKLAAWDRRYSEVLNSLTGQIFGTSWDRWMEWYGQNSLDPPPGFAEWKGRVLSGIDPRFTEFLYEGVPSTIRIEQIAWGGVPVDGITALDEPPVLSVADATYLDPNEPVFGVISNGAARAYPLRIMDPHELVNDTLGGRPISLVYCTLCGTGIAFDGQRADGTLHTFGTSGLLFQSNKLMYDRQTGSLWNQFTGRPVVGPLVTDFVDTSGTLLPILPLVIATWESWSSLHPETTVLDINTGQGFGYTLGYPYLDYFSSGDTWFPVADRSIKLSAKDWVFGLDIAGSQKAYALRALLEGSEVVNDTVGDLDVAVIATLPLINVAAEAPGVGTLEYQVASEVRAYERPAGVTFALTSESGVLVDQNGGEWRLTEEALIADDGAQAPRVVGRTSFWFGWFQFFPRTEVFGARS